RSPSFKAAISSFIVSNTSNFAAMAANCVAIGSGGLLFSLFRATDGFPADNLIGEGGFSSVYKGILNSDDDRRVAIKVLHLQNRGAHKSFLAECEAWRNIRQ
nr:leucine-rich repeat protein [Tanacetum cinerariifolium]